MHVPWMEMMKSMPVHALSVAHFVCMWGIYTNLSCLPQYYVQILAFNVQDVSVRTFPHSWRITHVHIRVKTATDRPTVFFLRRWLQP